MIAPLTVNLVVLSFNKPTVKFLVVLLKVNSGADVKFVELLKKGTCVAVPLPPNLLLKLVQSAALSAPRLAAEAVGTFNVTTGVVVALATVEVISVPEVPIVKALISVTVPLFGVGMFKVDPTNDAAPVPVVVRVMASCFPAVAAVTKAVVAIC